MKNRNTITAPADAGGAPLSGSFSSVNNVSSGNSSSRNRGRTVLRCRSGTDDNLLSGVGGGSKNSGAGYFYNPTGVVRQKSNDQRMTNIMMRQLYIRAAATTGGLDGSGTAHPNPMKVIAGGCLMVGLMVLMIGIDFQKNEKGNDAIIRSQRQQSMKHGNNIMDDGFCRYDGQCDVGSTCAVRRQSLSSLSRSSSLYPGICEPIPYGKDASAMSISEEERHSVFDSKAHDPCLSFCMNELLWDEFFYLNNGIDFLEFSRKQSSESTMISTDIDWVNEVPIISSGRPKGCWIRYTRNTISKLNHHNTEVNDNVPLGLLNEIQELDHQEPIHNLYERKASIQRWMNDRYKFNVRYEPFNVYGDEKNNNQWMAYCFHPCENDNHCITFNDDATKPQGFICNAEIGSCQRNPNYWDSNDTAQNTKQTSDMVIVVAITHETFLDVQNLVASIRFWAPNNQVVLYNLLDDMTSEEMRTIQYEWKNVIDIRRWRKGGDDTAKIVFPDDDHYPAVLNKILDRWTPLIINETLHEYKSILWLDATRITLRGPIQPIEDITKRDGIFLVKEQGGSYYDNVKLSSSYYYDSKSYNELLNISESASRNIFPKSIHTKDWNVYSSSVQAYIYPSRYVKTIIIPMAKCAIDPDCTKVNLPTSNTNHNEQDEEQDEMVPNFSSWILSMAAYLPKVHAQHHTEEYVSYSTSQLVTNIEKPSPRFLWFSDRGGGDGAYMYTMLEERLKKKSPI